jgi:putative hydrolase of the HAD superfamily
VAGKLGVLRCFEGIFDICDAGYVPKPTASCYDHFCRAHDVEPTVSAMFEDIPYNLEAPHVLGMTTVLVRSEANSDHPVQQLIRSWVEPPAHVHHMTHDLAGFLAGVRPPSPSDDANSQPTKGDLTPAVTRKGA